ncbi:uncharacterized protein LOC120660300 isoform X2 [Panicum virgatum]|uniref:uncharacterized protein LOC120660300 isoform X2 n=1 Tax=Panicum virgatum TaxID=38727 RepID=UPI0019D53F7E|nr:uncharacterized protein LOC120660300 isoform X2 [Panicum virgatum]
MAVWRCFISQTHGWISSGLEEGSKSDRSGESLPSIAIRKGPCGCDHLPVSMVTSNLFPCVGWRHPSTWGITAALQWPYFVLVAPSITIPVEAAGSYVCCEALNLYWL